MTGFVERSAEHIAANPELYAEKFQKYGIKDSNGNEINVTAEELTKGLDKSGNKKAYIKSLRKAITSDTALAKVAIAEATGNLIMDTRKMADSALQGEKIASRADFNYLVENASQEEISALTEVFGVEDWGKITVDEFNAKMTELNENGTLKNAAEQMQRVKLAKESEATVQAKALPHRLSPKLSDGVHHYTSEKGANVALFKEGDTYHVYDYSTGNISKPMTMQDVNKALKSHYTSSDSKTAAAMPLTEATADLSSETKTAADSTNVESAAEEINYLVRDNSPNEFNPEGKSLKGQLEEALDNSKSKEQRYVYVGKFTQEFVNKLKEHIDIKMHPVVMNYRDAYLSMESKENGKYQGNNINYHNLGIDGLESAINSFGDPEYVILSTKNNKIELILEGSDYKGRQLFSVVEINTKTLNNNKFMDAHVVTTVYGHRGIHNRIIAAKNENRLIYNKNESAQGITPVQYQRNINANSLSGDNTITTNSIPDSSKKINSFEKNSSEKVSSYENLKAQNAEIAKFAEENIKDYKKLNDVNRRAVRAVIRQGRAYGLSDADIITVASVSAHSGAKIKFSKADCKRTNKKGETFYVDGFYDGDTDTITVNPEKTRSTDRLILHELLHDIVSHLGGSKKGFKIYKKLVKQAFDGMTEDEQIDVINKYGIEMGETRASVLTEEILSHYGEAFANKSFFEAMMKERQTLGKRILNFFKSAITDYQGDERLSRSARKFHKAFKKLFDEYSGVNQNTNAYDSNLRLSEGEKRNALAVDNYSEEEYNLSQENNSKNGENKNEQDYQNTGVLERGTLSAVGGSRNNVRNQSDGTGKFNAGVEIPSKARKINAERLLHTGISSGYLGKRTISTRYNYKRLTESILRGWEGKLADTDANGRQLSQDIKDRFKNTVFKNENGELLSIYHWTPNSFDVFAYGDIGFHFGTYNAALDRRKGKPESQIGLDIVKEVYLNITNPIFLEDLSEWDAVEISYQLWEKDLISLNEKNRLQHTKGANYGRYEDEASIAIRKVLERLGYDGIIYQNTVEDKGTLSVMALYPEQIYTVAEESLSNKRYALSADFDIAKGSISEEATKKAQSTLKELKSRLKSTPSAILATQIQFTNQQAGIEAAGKALGVKEIEAEVQAVRASRNQAQEMLAGQQWSIMGDKYVKEGDGFYKIIEPIQANGEEYYEDFQQFLFHRHNIDRMSLEERSIAKNNAKKAELAKLQARLKELQAELFEVNVNLKVLNKKRNETRFVAFFVLFVFLIFFEL